MSDKELNLGEPVQFDGSPYDWFVGRAPNAACSSFS